VFDTNFNRFKSVFAHKFFVSPADRNYLLARFARIYGMNEEFWWQSLQAIEKYLKAGLVLNNISVKKGFGHNIKKLWEKHLDSFDDCAVKTLSKPKSLADDRWNDTPLHDFILQINQMGHPGSRYGLISYSNNKDDLFKLDQLAFELRRRTIGLEWVAGKDWEDEKLSEFYGQTYQTVIQQKPSYQIRGVTIPKGNFETVGANLEDLYYAWNLAFVRDLKDIEKQAPVTVAPQIPGFGNSYLSLLFDKAKEKDLTTTDSEYIEWLLSNIQIGKEAESAFRDLPFPT